MILIVLAFTALNLTKTEFADTVECSSFGCFEVIQTQIYKGEIEWDATQGDSLITSEIPIESWDYNKIYMQNIENLAIGYFVINDLPINDWEVVIPNTGSNNQLFNTFQPLNKLKMRIGFRANATGMRTVQIWVIRYNI